MQTRSPDRSPEEPLKQGWDLRWTQEMKFYLGAFVLSQILYFGGTEGAVTWINWVRQRTSTVITSPPTLPPPTIHLHQQQLLSAQIAQHAQKNVIQALTISALHANDQQTRNQATQALKNLGVILPAQPPPQIVLADRKG